MSDETIENDEATLDKVTARLESGSRRHREATLGEWLAVHRQAIRYREALGVVAEELEELRAEIARREG